MRRTMCPPGPRWSSLDAQPTGETFYALRSSLGDWSTGYESEWTSDSGCLRSPSRERGHGEKRR